MSMVSKAAGFGEGIGQCGLMLMSSLGAKGCCKVDTQWSYNLRIYESKVGPQGTRTTLLCLIARWNLRAIRSWPCDCGAGACSRSLLCFSTVELRFRGFSEGFGQAPDGRAIKRCFRSAIPSEASQLKAKRLLPKDVGAAARRAFCRMPSGPASEEGR